MPACNLTCWSGLLPLSGEPAGVYCMQERESCIPTEHWKKPFSKPFLTSLIERLGDLQHLLRKKSREVPGYQVKVLGHKSRRPEARAMTLM